MLDLVGHISWLSASAGCQSCHCAAGLCECMDLVCMSSFFVLHSLDKAHAKLSPPKRRNGSRASYVSIAVRATSHQLETGKLYHSNFKHIKKQKNIKNRLKKQHQVWQSRLTQLEPSSNFHGLSPSRSDKISDTFCFAILRWVLAAPPARVMACMHTLMALTSGKDDFASFPPSDPSLCPRLYHWRVS